MFSRNTGHQLHWPRHGWWECDVRALALSPALVNDAIADKVREVEMLKKPRNAWGERALA